MEPSQPTEPEMVVNTSTTSTSTPLPSTSPPPLVPSTAAAANTSGEGGNEEGFCKYILYVDIADSRVGVWDLLLLLPTLLFLIGLLLKINSARLKLRAVHSPIYATFYGLIWLNTLVSLARCIVSMTVSATTHSGDVANKLLYVFVCFFLLTTEMSVVIFAIFFGHLDNRTSIRRVLVVTSMIALPYAAVQGALEVLAPDPDFYVSSRNYDLFGHGGSLFWLASSVVFTLIYSFILVLRLDCLRKRFLFLLWMPMKRAFYIYLGFLVCLNLLQSVGCLLHHLNIFPGLCLVNLTTWTYLSLLTPLIYYTFISEFFGQKSREQVENIVFSYKSEDEDDTSSLPLPGPEFPQQNIYQCGGAPYSSLSEDGLVVGGVVGGIGVSGRDIHTTPINPLYTASLQSPDSITGYSINSVDDITITAYNKSQMVQ
ncbi:transmembrane protein adipocyte-associated 1-like [Eriocheir sinensis]|uniref:transmembrane protein adipocyte-associated 1-like n=1 Tax=Eriocheir sinensis TaxID=95602 RepID=UPI0021C67D5C|nr:transmembrane protein adipocyte-associated 1-like [Eriocheir sinensis]XP_050694011.1 transmembrane protein adipocyte-associated 1-like [Eriocheir sinensis]